jgi:integrase
MRMDTNTTPSTAVTVAEILHRYERDCLPELAPRTQVDYGRCLVRLRMAFGHLVATEMQPKDFATFINVKKGKVYRVKQLAVLSAALTQAVSFWYWIPRNVLRDVARPKFRPRDRLVTAEEFAAVRALAPYRVQLAMDLAVMTGQRQGDLLNLKWSDVKGMDLHLEQSKTGKRLAIEVTPDLEAVLDKCWQLPSRGRYILSPRRGGDQFTGEGFRAMWQRNMRKALRRGAISSRFTFHDLRALAATRCASPEIAMRLLGHTNISMTLRVYRRGVERVKALGLRGDSHDPRRNPNPSAIDLCSSPDNHPRDCRDLGQSSLPPTH